MSKSPKIFKQLIMNKIDTDIINFLNSKRIPNINGFTPPILLKHKKVLSELVFLYLYDKETRPLSIAYSGGKDSSVTLDLTLKALMLIKYIYGDSALFKKTYVLFSDTLMELDPVINGILKSLKEATLFCDKHKLNVKIEKVSPELKNRMWSLVIGKGYILPTPSGKRWCSQRLKVLPQSEKIKEILSENNQGFIAITGQRQDESKSRKEGLAIRTIEGSFKRHDYKNCSLFTPIESWTSNDVWDYIYSSSFDWMDKNELGKVYAEASGDGDECRSLLMGVEGTSPGCGKSGRFGCYMCSIHVNKDKTLISLGKHYPYLQKMEKFRNWLVPNAEGDWDWKRDIYIHGKHIMKKYDIKNHRIGMQLPGGYSLYHRKQILQKLMDLESDILQDRIKALGTDGRLISDEELSYIQEIWIEDGDTDMSVKKICKHRDVTVSEKYEKVVRSAIIMRDRTYYNKEEKDDLYSDNWKAIEGLNSNVCSRYYTQMALQIEDRDYDSHLIIDILRNAKAEMRIPAIKFIKTLPLETKMDFANEVDEEYIRSEWKRDEIGFMTFLEMYQKNEIDKPQKLLFGYGGDYAKHFEALDELEKTNDITLVSNKSISIEDKMRYFDTY